MVPGRRWADHAGVINRDHDVLGRLGGSVHGRGTVTTLEERTHARWPHRSRQDRLVPRRHPVPAARRRLPRRDGRRPGSDESRRGACRCRRGGLAREPAAWWRRRHRHRRRHRRAHRADPGRRRGRGAGLLREAAVGRPRRGRGDRPPRERARDAGAGRLPAPLRPRFQRRPRRGRVRRARLGPHGALDHAGPLARAARVHRDLRWDLPRLQRARLRHRPLGDGPGGRRGLCHRERTGRGLLRRARRRGHRGHPADVRRRRDRGRVEHPVQPAGLRRAPRAARDRGQRRRRMERHDSPAQPRAGSNLACRTAGHLLHGPAHDRLPCRAAGVQSPCSARRPPRS